MLGGSSPLYAIWSEEHQGWWRQSRWGYTARLAEAGLFLKPEADMIVENANFSKFNECAFLITPEIAALLRRAAGGEASG